MKKIGIITKLHDPEALAATASLAHWLKVRGLSVAISRETGEIADIPESTASRHSRETLPEGSGLLVVIGGDGTFIAAARAAGGRDIPLFGINMGRLGFLTEVPLAEMFNAMEDALAGRYVVEERVMLTARVIRDGVEVLHNRVLNDVVVHKGALARMIELEVTVDGQFVFSSRADGLIVATPTGSTAYALSSGGPIIHPKLDAILMVPISPHTLSNRPIAMPGDGKIKVGLRNTEEQQEFLITMDGQKGFELQTGDEILIRKSRKRLKLMHAPDRNYYDILRQKLRWGEPAELKPPRPPRPAPPPPPLPPAPG